MSEEVYDLEIAPVLMSIAEQCKAMGISFVASVEYEPGKIATTVGGKPQGVEQDLVRHAAACNGNVDGMLIALVRKYGPGNSIYLRAGDLSDC